MANFRGVNNTLRENVPSEKIAIGEARGNLRVAYDEFTFTAIIDTTDILFMQELPQGARVYDAILEHADLGDTGAFNIGWQASPLLDAGGTTVEAADADGFWVTLDVNSAADVVSIRTTGAAPTPGYLKKFAGPVQVVIVPSTITTATSGDVKLSIYYAVE